MNSFAILFCVACGLALALAIFIALLVVTTREYKRVVRDLKRENERLMRPIIEQQEKTYERSK